MSSTLSELQEKLQRKGINPTAKELDFYLFPKKKIKEEEQIMSSTDLTMRLKKFARSYYGKEPADQDIKNAVKSLCRRFMDLSIYEIEYMLEQIVEGIYPEVKKFSFNLSDITYVIAGYEKRKKLLTSAVWEIRREHRQDQETKQRAKEFLQEALKKEDAGEELTVYEKSTLGKHYAEHADPNLVKDVREQADNELEQRKKELGAIRKIKSDSKQIPCPDMYVAPMAWSSTLLFGYLMYNTIKGHEKD